MSPSPGERLQRFVGDRLRFTLADGAESAPRARAGARDCAPTSAARRCCVKKSSKRIPKNCRSPALPGMTCRCGPRDGEWSLDLPLTEPGYFKAKAYLLDPRGWQHWPDGPDVGISVHPGRVSHGEHHLLRLHADVWRNADTRAHGERKAGGAIQAMGQEGLHRHPAFGQIPRSDPPTAAHHRHARLPHFAFAARQSHAHHLCPLRAFWQSLCEPGLDGH